MRISIVIDVLGNVPKVLKKKSEGEGNQRKNRDHPHCSIF